VLVEFLIFFTEATSIATYFLHYFLFGLLLRFQKLSFFDGFLLYYEVTLEIETVNK